MRGSVAGRLIALTLLPMPVLSRRFGRTRRRARRGGPTRAAGLVALALAGSLAGKKIVPASAGTFPVSGFTFIVLLVGTVILVGALTFLPALALGPVVEHLMMIAGH